jgi:hypothetical protein
LLIETCNYLGSSRTGLAAAPGQGAGLDDSRDLGPEPIVIDLMAQLQIARDEACTLRKTMHDEAECARSECIHLELQLETAKDACEGMIIRNDKLESSVEELRCDLNVRYAEKHMPL